MTIGVLYVLGILGVFALIAIQIFIVLFSGIAIAFLTKIDWINSAVIVVAEFTFLYVWRNLLGHFAIHPAIITIISIVTFIAVILFQKTKVGFWIFAIIMSPAWTAIPGYLVYYFTQDKIWGGVVFAVSTLINLGCHFRANSLKTASTNSNQNNQN